MTQGRDGSGADEKLVGEFAAAENEGAPAVPESEPVAQSMQPQPMEPPSAPPPSGIRESFALQDVASWVLRGGVFLSVLTMVVGLVAALASPSGVHNLTFASHLRTVWTGLGQRQPFAVMELGILLLVFTPIVRVAASVVIFAYERDLLYAVTTLLVLVMVLASLFWVR